MQVCSYLITITDFEVKFIKIFERIKESLIANILLQIGFAK